VSWQATAWAVRQATGSPSRKLILLTLANYADASGVAFPGQDTLAKDTEQSVDTVQRQLKQLADLGLIRIEKRTQFKGRWAGRLYFLNMPVAEMSEPQIAARSDDDHAAPGPATRPHPARRPGRKAVRHEQSIEQSIEPSRARAANRRDGCDIVSPLGAAGEALAKRIGNDRFASFFGKVEVATERDGEITLTAPTAFLRDHIATQFEIEMAEAWRTTTPGFQRIVVVSKTDQRQFAARVCRQPPSPEEGGAGEISQREGIQI